MSVRLVQSSEAEDLRDEVLLLKAENDKLKRELISIEETLRIILQIADKEKQ